jgi:alpha-glucosidase
VFARQERGTQNCYIGGINAEEEREVTIPLSMLKKGKNYQATIWRDGEKAHWENNPYEYVIEEKEVSSEDTLRIQMASGGGFAVEVKGER